MNRGIDKSLQIKTGSESARRPRQHNPLPTGEVVCSVFELREEATCLARRQKKAKLPSGKTLTGFTKQFTCSAPEPIFPTGRGGARLRRALISLSEIRARRSLAPPFTAQNFSITIVSFSSV